MRQEKKKEPQPKARTSRCKVCGAALPRGVEQCMVCGTIRGSKVPLHPVEPQPAETPAEVSPGAFRRARTLMGRFAAVLALVLVVSALGVSAFEYASYLSLLSRYTLDNAILYQQGGNSLKLTLESTSQPFELTDKFQTSSSTLTAKESNDNRFLGYLNNQRNVGKGMEGTLYLLDLLSLDEESSELSGGVKVSEQPVVDFLFLPKEDSMVFLTNQGELHLADYRSFLQFFGVSNLQTTLLDIDVKGLGTISENQLLYYKGNNADSTTYKTNIDQHTGTSFDLYSLELHERREKPVLVAKNVYAVLDSTRYHNHIYYTKRTHVPPLSQYDIYRYDSTEQQEVQIATNVWHIVEASANKGRILYLSPLQDMIRYEDLFDDDMQEIDNTARRLAESEASLPSYDGYYETPAQEEQLDSVITPEEERILRDQFRAHMKSNIRDIKQETYLSFDLYEYSGMEVGTRRLAGPIYYWDTPDKLITADLSRDFAVFVQSNPDQMNRQKISDFTTLDLETYLEIPFELLPFLSEHLPDSLCRLTLSTGEIHKVFTEPGPRYISDFYTSPQSSDVYFITYANFNDTSGTLYHAPLTGGLSDKVVHIDEDVSDIVSAMGKNYQSLLYQTQTHDDPPKKNLFRTTETGVQEVALDVGAADTVSVVGGAQDTVLYFRNYSQSTTSGDLYLYDAEGEIKIADGIVSISSFDDDVLFIVRRESSSFHSLYQLKNGELTLLDSRLGGYLTFSEK